MNVVDWQLVPRRHVAFLENWPMDHTRGIQLFFKQIVKVVRDYCTHSRSASTRNADSSKCSEGRRHCWIAYRRPFCVTSYACIKECRYVIRERIGETTPKVATCHQRRRIINNAKSSNYLPNFIISNHSRVMSANHAGQHRVKETVPTRNAYANRDACANREAPSPRRT